MTEDMHETIMTKDHVNKAMTKELQPYSGALQICCLTEEMTECMHETVMTKDTHETKAMTEIMHETIITEDSMKPRQ